MEEDLSFSRKRNFDEFEYRRSTTSPTAYDRQLSIPHQIIRDIKRLI